LTNEQLVSRIQAGDREQMETLLAQNSGFLCAVAREYLPAAQRNRGLDMDDLLQAAALGMIEAVSKWEESRGGFLTAAGWYVRGSIREALGIRSTKERIENMRSASLDQCVGEDEDTPLVELLPDPAATDPEQAAVDHDLQRIVREAVNGLPEVQRRAVQHRIYGGPVYPSTSRERSAAMEALRRNKHLRRLWTEYESACYWHTGLASWRHTHTSGPEAAAIYRERIRERITAVIGERCDLCAPKKGVPYRYPPSM